jgi:hypothetical protein
LSVLTYTYLYSIRIFSFLSSFPLQILSPPLPLFYSLIHSILVGTWIHIFIFFPSSPIIPFPTIWPRTNYRRDVSSGVVLFVWCLSWCWLLCLCFWAGVDVRCILYITIIIYYIILLYTIIYYILSYTILYSSSNLSSFPL